MTAVRQATWFGHYRDLRGQGQDQPLLSIYKPRVVNEIIAQGTYGSDLVVRSKMADSSWLLDACAHVSRR
jgi:hypothetical protein